MQLSRTSERLTWIILALACASAAAAGEPQKWLERMNRALTTLNYDGVFFHLQAGRVETLRIIHRVENGTVTERLMSLDGSGREFIRKGSTLACYLPDQHRVLVEHEPDSSLLLGRLPRFDAATSRYYAFKAVRQARLIGKQTQLVVVTPKDRYRYGYRLWIDEATGMPLKTQLCDPRGRVLEQVVFASIATPAHIPDTAFEPGIPTTGFTWVRQLASASAESAAGAPMPSWSALKLPPGFHMSVRAMQIMPGTTGLVEHLVYTDGIASVSVFVESHMHADHKLSGSEQIGSTSTFATMVDGHPVTAVGEVPPETVKFIAKSVQAQPAQLELRSPRP
ncbi:MAG: MucB/RseB C-terminal domain-containing protein [Steroidobacteraceae bacterium]